MDDMHSKAEMIDSSKDLAIAIAAADFLTRLTDPVYQTLIVTKSIVSFSIAATGRKLTKMKP